MHLSDENCQKQRATTTTTTTDERVSLFILPMDVSYSTKEGIPFPRFYVASSGPPLSYSTSYSYFYFRAIFRQVRSRVVVSLTTQRGRLDSYTNDKKEKKRRGAFFCPGLRALSNRTKCWDGWGKEARFAFRALTLELQEES